MKTVNLAFEEFGDSSKQTLIILHGFFASSRNWRQMAKKFSDYCHVYVLDIRNHGSSPHHPEMDYSIMAQDLLSFMDQHKCQTASILGHSMGGKVAMWFALNHPKRVRELIVADISPESYQHSFNHTIQALQSLPLEQIANRKQADDFLKVAIPELSYRQFLLQNLQLIEGKYCWRINLGFFYQTANNIIGFPKSEPVLSYPDKTLFIMGESSNYTNREVINKYFSQAEIFVLKGANHWLHVDQPGAFFSRVLEFLKN